MNKYFSTLGEILGQFWQNLPEIAAVITVGALILTLVILGLVLAHRLIRKLDGFKSRDTLTYAYLIGAYERYKLGDAFGRTHEGSQDWNEAYDRGANLIDRITGEKT